MTLKETLSRPLFMRRCQSDGIGNAHKFFSQPTMTLSGYDQKMDKKIHFLAVALCGICADRYARGRSQTYSTASAQRWMENLFFSARAWESIAFNNLLQQLLCRVSSSLGLNIVAPRLISSLWAELVANQGRVQKKNGCFMHNVVANSIDARCKVRLSGKLALYP